MTGPAVKTSTGMVRGTEENGVQVFYGIPYAAPPLGALRFAPPAPHAPWEGTHDATQPGPTAPQFVRPFPMVDLSPLVGDGWTRGDDFLTATVWTPDTGAKGLPVMVFLHGGAFSLGSGCASVNHGTEFARSGVVCFSLDFRGGIEGFLAAPGIPTNLGLRDAVAGLEWVRENAAAFGGDADNVTVFGESSGAMTIGLLLASGKAKGLFGRAILQSGHAGTYRPWETVMRVTDTIAGLLGVSPDAAGFASTTMEACVDALQTVALPTTRIDLRNESGLDPVFGIAKICPVVDDEWVPAATLAALAAGASSDVEVLVGTNREEMNLYFVPAGVRNTLTPELALAMLSLSHPRPAEVLAAFGFDDPGRAAGEVFTEALHDLVFRASARRFALAHRGRTHVYEFGWRSPACGGELGACHGLELPFVFNRLSTCTGPNGIAGENPPQELADSIHGLWVQFAKDGSLPWPEFTAEQRAVYALERQSWAEEAPLRGERFVLSHPEDPHASCSAHCSHPVDRLRRRAAFSLSSPLAFASPARPRPHPPRYGVHRFQPGRVPRRLHGGGYNLEHRGARSLRGRASRTRPAL